MNIGNPEQAFEFSFIPNDGIGLAREEFIINEYIKIHPLALLNYSKIKKESGKKDKESKYKKDTIQKIDFLSRGQTWLPLATLLAASSVGFADDGYEQPATTCGGGNL